MPDDLLAGGVLFVQRNVEFVRGKARILCDQDFGDLARCCFRWYRDLNAASASNVGGGSKK